MNPKIPHFILFILISSQLSSQKIFQWYGGIHRSVVQNQPLIAEPKNSPYLTLLTYQDGFITAHPDGLAKGFLYINGTTGFDLKGNISYFFNGLRVYDSIGNVMLGGDSFGIKFNEEIEFKNWSYYDTIYGVNFDLKFCQSIPMPKSVNKYLLFYTNSYLNFTNFNKNIYVLCYAQIDMDANNGLGMVTKKEIEITRNENLNPFLLLRHGNGRDWWMITSKNNDNIYSFYLIDENGVNYSHQSKAGPILKSLKSSFHPFKISSDGNSFAIIYQCNSIGLFNIDRCNGLIDFKEIYEVADPNCATEHSYAIDDCEYFKLPCIWGIEFSQDSRFLNVSFSGNLYQIDLNRNTTTLIGKQGNGLFAFSPQRFPNHKIYFHDGHELNRANLKGLSSDLNYFALNLPDTIFSPIYQWPDYYLGKHIGSVCDTL